MARMSRRVYAGFHGSGGPALLAGMETCRSAGVRESVEPVQGIGDHVVFSRPFVVRARAIRVEKAGV
jgi:hypothetical protein